jgi:hypothetical protein
MQRLVWQPWCANLSAAALAANILTVCAYGMDIHTIKHNIYTSTHTKYKQKLLKNHDLMVFSGTNIFKHLFGSHGVPTSLLLHLLQNCDLLCTWDRHLYNQMQCMVSRQVKIF